MTARTFSSGFFAIAFGVSLIFLSACDLSGPEGAGKANLSVQALQCPSNATVENVTDVCALVEKGGTLVFADSTFPVKRLSWFADGEHALYLKISFRKSDREDLCSRLTIEGDYCFVDGFVGGPYSKGRYQSFVGFVNLVFDTIPHWYVWQVVDRPGPTAKVLAADTSMYYIKLIVRADSTKSGT